MPQQTPAVLPKKNCPWASGETNVYDMKKRAGTSSEVLCREYSSFSPFFPLLYRRVGWLGRDVFRCSIGGGLFFFTAFLLPRFL